MWMLSGDFYIQRQSPASLGRNGCHINAYIPRPGSPMYSTESLWATTQCIIICNKSSTSTWECVILSQENAKQYFAV